MNRTDVITELAAKLGVASCQSRRFLDALEEVLTEALKEDKTIQFYGFGTFVPWKQTERPGVSVKFKPGKFLLNTLNGRKK